MNITAIIDLLNSSICFVAGLYILTRTLKIFESQHTELLPLLIVATGTFAWMLKFMLSAAPITPLPPSFDVSWNSNQGYTLARLMLTPAWLYMLYLIKQNRSTT